MMVPPEIDHKKGQDEDHCGDDPRNDFDCQTMIMIIVVFYLVGFACQQTGTCYIT